MNEEASLPRAQGVGSVVTGSLRVRYRQIGAQVDLHRLNFSRARIFGVHKGIMC